MSGASGSAEGRDPGLQAERTSLAWSRTALAASVAAMLVARDGVLSHRTPLTVAGLLLLVLAMLMLLTARRRYAVLVSRIAAGRTPASRRGALLVTALLVSLGAAVLWSVLG